jgi:hypothetical protein
MQEGEDDTHDSEHDDCDACDHQPPTRVTNRRGR